MARSIMFGELSELVRSLPVNTSKAEYRTAIVVDNLLGKPTQASRKKSLIHLVQLYGLDPSLILFQSLRRFAVEDPESLPLLALVCAYCRDPQLRQSFGLIESLRSGAELTRIQMEEHIESGFPGRFSSAMKKSLAQNVNTSWGVAGHLIGKTHKKRALPTERQTATAYAAFAGFLLGLRGNLLLKSVFMRLVSADHSTVLSHLSSASSRGWLRFLSSGGVTEIDFEPLIRRHEQEVLHGAG